MSDELVLNNYLMLLKSNTEVYVHGTIESANESVRDLLNCGLNETLCHLGCVFDMMVEYDYYVVNNIDPSEIEKTYDSICNKD